MSKNFISPACILHSYFDSVTIWYANIELKEKKNLENKIFPFNKLYIFKTITENTVSSKNFLQYILYTTKFKIT